MRPGVEMNRVRGGPSEPQGASDNPQDAQLLGRILLGAEIWVGIERDSAAVRGAIDVRGTGCRAENSGLSPLKSFSQTALVTKRATSPANVQAICDTVPLRVVAKSLREQSHPRGKIPPRGQVVYTLPRSAPAKYLRHNNL